MAPLEGTSRTIPQGAPLHARLVQNGATKWLLRDLGSKNGIRLDGARCSQIELAPGDEIGIGGLTDR